MIAIFHFPSPEELVKRASNFEANIDFCFKNIFDLCYSFKNSEKIG